ncbi:MAG TPA: peptide-methionine (S)-S-oxide reductase MsrA [Thermoanaerobaculia bacterium]|nr:peptide-methionine (S)-S-oxide reductase MsrA [Thermoanaerobaculia bacterium]
MRRLLLLLLLLLALPLHAAPFAKAIFAGGCFWCMESDFEKVRGVVSVVSGYTGGHVANPTYDQVSSSMTGHREAVEVTYDPAQVTYGQLVDVFWRNVDPLDDSGQFCDRGESYTAAIFWSGAEQRRIAEISLRNVQQRFRPERIGAKVLPASAFYRAEEYHQDYYKKNPLRYRFYRRGCGRDARLKKVWGR